MSELDRSETGALTESPTLLPTHAEPGGAGAASPTRTTEPKEPAPGAAEPPSNGTTGNGPSGNKTSGNEASGGTTADGAPKKRRRRGSRGGRGRKKPGTGAAGGSAVGTIDGGPVDEPDAPDTMEGSEDWTSAEADRGLTADDIAEQARDDAGLAPARAGGARVMREGIDVRTGTLRDRSTNRVTHLAPDTRGAGRGGSRVSHTND